MGIYTCTDGNVNRLKGINIYLYRYKYISIYINKYVYLYLKTLSHMLEVGPRFQLKSLKRMTFPSNIGMAMIPSQAL